ncbi:MAG: hypothetical protein WCA28_30650 [Bradyrhizobium sp.]
MPDRAAKFVSAIVASVLAGTSLAAISLNAVRAADDCLAAPNAETPAGGHWYYRIDRATKRHCWYLRTEGETLPQAAVPNSAPDSSAAAKPVAPVAAAPMQRSVADAHAELTAQTGIEPPRRNGGLAPAMPANPAASENNKAAAPGADAAQSVVASRWLDPSAMSSMTLSPPPAPSQVAANVPPESQTDSTQPGSTQSDSSQSDSAAAPPSAAAAVPLAAADSSQGLPASLPMLLAVMTGALALAGLTASLVLKFGGARRTVHLRVRREKLWEAVDDDRIGLSPSADADVIPRRPHFPRDLDQPAEPNDRVAKFYAQLSKQARAADG